MDRTVVHKPGKDVFLGFFIIRKLLEARKLSVQVESTPVRVMTQPWKGNHRITHLNWDRFDSDAYDSSAAANETLPLLDLCNLFVHSCIYVPLMSDDRQLEGLFVSSDRSRHQKLFYIDAIQTVALLRAVANDSAEHMEAKRSGRTGECCPAQSQLEPPWVRWRLRGVHLRPISAPEIARITTT
jgi:transcriptional regulator with GAF, ATPase, and Fis domain